MKKYLSDDINATYYAIPVSSTLIKCGSKTLHDILEDNDVELAKREDEYYGFYGEPIFDSVYFDKFMKNFNLKTRKIFAERNIIYNLLIEKDCDGLHEIVTKMPLKCKYDGYLNLPQFSRTKKEIANYLENDKYIELVNKFFNNGMTKENSFVLKKN